MARLTVVRDRLTFVDGCSLPVVADGRDVVRVWPFAGGLASASLARAFTERGLRPLRWDEFSVSVRGTSTEPVAQAIAGIDPANAWPALPDDMADALKFSECLPNSTSAAVLRVRTAVPDAIAEIVSRPIRLLRA
jgi:hypothetical protein